MSTALIALAPTSREPHTTPCVTTRSLANFVAQLIAVSTKAPQTCARRRVEPDEANAAYAAQSPPTAARLGDVLKRSL